MSLFHGGQVGTGIGDIAHLILLVGAGVAERGRRDPLVLTCSRAFVIALPEDLLQIQGSGLGLVPIFLRRAVSAGQERVHFVAPCRLVKKRAAPLRYTCLLLRS